MNAASTTEATHEFAIPASAPVLVTGVTGYVAGWIKKRLLEAGVTVHAAVRNPDDEHKLAHRKAMAETGPGTVRVFASALLQPGSCARAMAKCEVVFHTASPFAIKVKDPQRELIDPGAVLTEAVWNSTSSLLHEPHSYLKTLAEQQGWRLAEDGRSTRGVRCSARALRGAGASGGGVHARRRGAAHHFGSRHRSIGRGPIVAAEVSRALPAAAPATARAARRWA